MSITIHKQPPSLSPTYNPMIIAVTGSYQSESNHQFIATLFVGGQQVSRLKIPTNPEGYGVFDIHRHVENQITYDFNPEFWGWNIATNSFATYSLQFAEEFRYEWSFYDNAFVTGAFVGFLGPTGGPQPLFNVGDFITVTQDGNPTNPEYDGNALITGITQSGSSWLIITNKPFLQSSPAEGGIIQLANFELTTVNSTASITQQYAWNGVFGFLDYINYDYTDYVPNTSAPYAQFLTNMPNYWEVGTQSRAFFLTYKEASNQQKDLMIQSNKGTFRITSPFSASVDNNPNYRLNMVGVGPYELLTYTSSIILGPGATLPIIDADTKTYSVWTRNQTLQQDTEVKIFKIKDYCSRYEKIQIIFLDKKGSFIPFTFNKVSRENKNIEKTRYKQYYGEYAPASNSWTYNTWDRGTTTLDVRVSENYTVVSDWVNQTTSNYLMELFESPEVYWIKEDGTTVAIDITNTQVERKQTINDQIINYTLQFEVAQKDMKQKG